MRSSSSNINNTILNQSNSISSSNSSKSSGISRKPTSALSKIGKHVPPPISPIIAFKSTTTTSKAKTTTTTSTKSGLSDDKTEKTTSSLAVNSSTCAWRIPKAVTETAAPVNQSSNYPQRKVPELTPPVPVVVKEPEKPKGFLERFEEFPNLLKQQSGNTVTSNTTTAAATSVTSSLAPPQRPPQKLLGGDFNFLEDDDWLEGDNIDYSQNLFEDDNHFLPSYILEEETKVINNEQGQGNGGLCHVKAKSLLAERHHSSKKNDIWKRTDNQLQEQPKMKIKILKRPEQQPQQQQPQETQHDLSVITKKFTTSLNIKESQQTETTPVKTSETKPPSKIKIVYSSASKTLQKM